MNFWHITSEVNTEINIGKKVRQGLKMEEVTKEIVNKYELKEDITVM